MKVKVRYLGYIDNLVRKRDDEFEFSEGASLSELLNKLAGIQGEAFRREVFESGLRDVKTGFVVPVNGVLIGQLSGVNAKLSEGDNVIFMTLVSGGQALRRLQSSSNYDRKFAQECCDYLRKNRRV